MSGAAFRCWNCGRSIGRTSSHWLLDGGLTVEVVCGGCAVRSNTRGTAQRVQGRGPTSDQSAPLRGPL